jgi:hypothetical protein
MCVDMCYRIPWFGHSPLSMSTPNFEITDYRTIKVTMGFEVIEIEDVNSEVDRCGWLQQPNTSGDKQRPTKASSWLQRALYKLLNQSLMCRTAIGRQLKAFFKLWDLCHIGVRYLEVRRFNQV